MRKGFSSVSLVPLLLLAGLCQAGWGEQTEWSGGPGVLGPSSSFGSGFLSSTGLDWLAADIGLRLLPQVFELNPYSPCVRSMVCGDPDGDGDVDIVCSCCDPNQIAWLENLNGTGSEWAFHSLAIGWGTHVTLGDMDDDQDLDVIGATGDDLYWWENTGGVSWTAHMVWPVNFTIVVSGDLDADGDEDVAAERNSVIYWFENKDGAGTDWSVHPILGNCDATLDIGDVNGDGTPNLVSNCSGEIFWLDGVPPNTWEKHVIGVSQNTVKISVNDMNADGYLDIVGVSGSTAVWWENPGEMSDSWVAHSFSESFQGGLTFAVGDMTGDGIPEVLVSVSSGIQWWEHGQDQGSWNGRVLCDDLSSGNWLVALGDLDGDGMAVPLAGAWQHSLRFWTYDSFLETGILESSVLDTGTNPIWGTIDWDAETPEGTGVSFQVRASDNYVQMGEWSDTLSFPGSLQGILGNGARFVQYRAILQTEIQATPVLHSVSLQWNELGVTPEARRGNSLSVFPNPCAGLCTVRISGEVQAPTIVQVYDVSGRIVSILPIEDDSEVDHFIPLELLLPGIYIVRMESEEGIESYSFVVLKGRI